MNRPEPVSSSGDERDGTRSLSAILFADVKDFSRRMHESESLGIEMVATVRAVFEEVVPSHGGTYEVSGGDTFLALFGSAASATTAAIKIQLQLRLVDPAAHRGHAPRIRIGLHMGDVTRTPHGLMGDSINTAARIQNIAEPGGISVSEDVYRAVRTKLTVPFHNCGPQELKNVGYDGCIYRLDPAEAVGGGSPAKKTPPAQAAWSRRGVLAGGAALGGVALLAWFGERTWRTPGNGAEGPVGLDPNAEHRPRTPPEIPPPKPGPIVVGLMDIECRGSVDATQCGFTRDSINAILTRVDALRVYSKEKIDFLREKRGLSQIEAAEQLGVEKMISGALANQDGRLMLQIHVVDVASGLNEFGQDIYGQPSRLTDLQNRAATSVLQGLRVTIATAEWNRILAARSADSVDTYGLVAEQMGGMLTDDDGTPTTTLPKSTKPHAWNWPSLASTAWAAADDDAAVHALLESYRSALEAQDLQRLAEIHVDLNDKMRGALSRYFETVQGLHVKFSNVDVLVEGDEALATFTRTDDFKDAATGRDMHFEVRVSSVLARQGGAWKIKGLKKPS